MTRNDTTIWVGVGIALVGILVGVLGVGTLLKGIVAIAVALALISGAAWLITKLQKQ